MRAFLAGAWAVRSFEHMTGTLFHFIQYCWLDSTVLETEVSGVFKLFLVTEQ